MIGLRDATMLALTKLRTRKVRLTVTIVVSGLLFSGLATASFITRGIINGINDFGKEGLGSRYIAEVYSQVSFDYQRDPVVLDRATAIQKELIARKQVEAKRLGVAYDASTEPAPIYEFEGPNGKERSLDTTTPAGKQAALEYLAANPMAGKDELQKIAAPYQAKEYFSAKMLPYDLQGAQLQVLKGGEEAFDQTNDKNGRPNNGAESLVQLWLTMSQGLLDPFILPGQNLEVGTDGSIPILAPQTAVEEILRLESLPASASNKDRLERTKEIREKAPSVTFGVCYRNSSSADLIRQAVTTEQEIERNKNKKDYQKPDLIYETPAEPCGAASVARDVRSTEEKTQAAKQQEFDRIFGTPAPEQSVITFRIVGIMPDVDFGYGNGPAFGIGQILSSLVTSSVGGGWFTPLEATTNNPTLNKLFDTNTTFGSSERLITEFNTSAQAKRFIEEESCAPDHGNQEVDPATYCIEQGHPFSIAPFGSNSLALEDARKIFGKFFGITALVVSAIAAIIMMGTVGRMIADSRRETAVFRAIGAKKLDIAEIYIIYSICLSLLIAAFAIVAGLAVALFVDYRWSPEVTAQALTAYNAQDLNKTFSLYALHLPDMLLLGGLSLAAGLLSAVFPLMRNLRRNPIRDMRDDT